MTGRPSDRELDRLLAALPRESASPGFARRVLDDVATGSSPLRRRGWLVAAAAAAAAAAVAVGLWLVPRAAPRSPVVDTRALELEHRLLMDELESLKASLRAAEPAPVLYLGGTESVDLVLDLRPVWRGDPRAGVRPAVLGAGERPLATPTGGGDPR